MSKKFNNTNKTNFLNSIPEASIDSLSDKLSRRCKFNFHYFDNSQGCSQSFSDWEKASKLSKLMDKLKNYSEQSLSYWRNQRVGKKNNKVLEVYGAFPNNSDFTHPKHVPFEAEWARFRLESDDRLIGFVLPHSYHKRAHTKTNELFCCNTFYVVFLDENHVFYKTK